jgi:DNA-binding NarL/FixJ family response regulator
MCGRLSKKRKMRVLIADDSPVVVERLVDLLKDVPGVELVGQAKDAPEAVRHVYQLSPDVVILDLQIPGGNGLNVIRAIRPAHPGLDIVVCTNFSHSRYRKECLTAGANFFLDKSMEFEKIPAILRDLIRSHARTTTAGR